MGVEKRLLLAFFTTGGKSDVLALLGEGEGGSPPAPSSLAVNS